MGQYSTVNKDTRYISNDKEAGTSRKHDNMVSVRHTNKNNQTQDMCHQRTQRYKTDTLSGNNKGTSIEKTPKMVIKNGPCAALSIEPA